MITSLLKKKCITYFTAETSTEATDGNTDEECAVLNIFSIVGAVMALLFAIPISCACGLLMGRSRKNHIPSASGDLSPPTYEQVLPQAQISIPLNENEAYGHI